MEPLLETKVLKNVFGDAVNTLGSVQEYIDCISQLHHYYLESQLRENGSRNSLDLSELERLARSAHFLATQYTNTLVTEGFEGLPVDEVPRRESVQDARSIAGTIFEFLGDAISVQEDRLLG